MRRFRATPDAQMVREGRALKNLLIRHVGAHFTEAVSRKCFRRKLRAAEGEMVQDIGLQFRSLDLGAAIEMTVTILLLCES